MNNGMVDMDEIRCQQGHTEHPHNIVDVDLFREHLYHDYPQIPGRLARRFRMAVWDWRSFQFLPSYCPAYDCVSETIERIGCWEPCETIITLAAMTAADPDSIFVDFGAQIGWFSMLAASTGHDVVAFEADPDCMRLIRHSMILNGWDDCVVYRHERVAADSLTWLPIGRHIAMAKIDIEGAEEHAVNMLWPSIEAGLVDHLLIEISPVFNDSYPDLVVRLLEAGYEAWWMPDKATPPPRFEQFPRDLEATQLWPQSLELRRTLPSEWHGHQSVAAEVASWHQRNVLFSRPGAPI